jgi:hypothetical protein
MDLVASLDIGGSSFQSHDVYSSGGGQNTNLSGDICGGGDSGGGCDSSVGCDSGGGGS